MPSTEYVLKYGEPALLEISWSGGWFYLKENFEIRYNGQTLGKFATRNDLEAAPKFELPDGATFEVKIIADRFSVLYNGKALADIPNVKTIQSCSFFLALGLVIFGLTTYIFKISPIGPISFFESPPYTIGSELEVNVATVAIFGLAILFLIEGFLAKRSDFFGNVGFSFLIFLSTFIAKIAVPYLLGANITPWSYIFIIFIFFAFLVKVYNYQRQQTTGEQP